MMTSRNPRGIFLDTDSSILEDNLRFVVKPEEDELSKFFTSETDNCPSRLVKPSPGFCVKTKEVGIDTKFFVNVCTTDAIPEPKDITEGELEQILNSDEPSTYRIPMSIGEIRQETDKKGEEARACDIAINPKFFRKIETQPLFKDFFMTLVFEALTHKYGTVCSDEKIILKNRKCFGTLQMHRIRQKEIKEKMGDDVSSVTQQISGSNSGGGLSQDKKVKIETISSSVTKTREPEYRLFRKKSQPNCLIGEFRLPDIISAKELTLDLGEDRIVLEAPSKGYFLDIFVPHFVRQNSCSSNFNKTTKILTITMPLAGG